jgi:hypothetical protein
MMTREIKLHRSENLNLMRITVIFWIIITSSLRSCKLLPFLKIEMMTGEIKKSILLDK